MASASPGRRVAIVVLNFNGLADTLTCLASLRALADPVAAVILVDNGSTIDPGPEAVRVYPALEYIATGRNLGYAGGNNRGIERAMAMGVDFILVINNDTTVDPHILGALVDAFERDSTLGIVGPVVNFMDEPAVVMTDGVAFNPGPGTEFFKRIPVPVDGERPALVPVDIVNGCCMMMSARLVRTVGLFDEQFFIVHEESDLCLRAGRAGFTCAVLGRSLVWHKGSSAFERSGRQIQRYFDARNLYHLLKRHTGRVARSRPWGPSLFHYLKYAFYRYDIESDAGKTTAADAVIAGVYDALRGRFGGLDQPARPGLPLLRTAFAAGRRFRS
jgi:GT2 family glycosyltransferase